VGTAADEAVRDAETSAEAADIQERVMSSPGGERLELLREAKGSGQTLLDAVRRVKDADLREVGKEFNVAVDLKEVYGLPVRQLADIVGWLRGVVSDEELENSLA
jgi:hypothetical protein